MAAADTWLVVSDLLQAPNATLVMYPDGTHVCNNITYKYRPLMADWLRERLA